MNIKELIENGTKKLKISKVESPNMKARILMQYILGKPRKYLIINNDKVVDKKIEERFLKEIENIINGTPLEHITHEKEFMKLNFYVDENVLIPRQDTEILVEEVIEILKGKNEKNILDLCTGSGNIAISIAKYVEDSKITAVDISKKALKVAKMNATKNGVESQIKFIESDLFEKVKEKKYTVLVSNPPYIKKDEILKLDKNVQKEPYVALNGGEDGLKFYKNIIKEAYKYLNKNGYLCLEIGYDQKQQIERMIKDEQKYTDTYCKKDLNGNDRVIITKVI